MKLRLDDLWLWLLALLLILAKFRTLQRSGSRSRRGRELASQPYGAPWSTG